MNNKKQKSQAELGLAFLKIIHLPKSLQKRDLLTLYLTH